MTKFDKTKFTYHGGYLKYEDEFVARFKYSGAVNKGVFLTQLVKNHTVEEYFHKLKIDHVAPLVILRDADPKWYDDRLEKFREKLLAKVSF
jgi:hypothetical protein